MNDDAYFRHKAEHYIFRVITEPNEDRWRADQPELEPRGAATWGTRYEAVRNIPEVLEMIVDER